MKQHILIFLLVLFTLADSSAQIVEKDYQLIRFGEGGTKKMTYDRRQRPQAILMGNEIHLVYNGGAQAEVNKLVRNLNE